VKLETFTALNWLLWTPTCKFHKVVL